MKIIGLTGGIATGKSCVSEILLEKGIPVLDGDKIAKELARPGKALWLSYRERYGEKILQENGELDRLAIGKIIFNNKEERAWIDKVAQPLILAEINMRLDYLKRAGARIAIIDIPLLFEAGWDRLVDYSWVVYVPKALQLERLMKRNSLLLEDALSRIEAQMPLEEKCNRADEIIDNSGDLKALREKVEELLKNIGRKGKERRGWTLIKKSL